MVSEEVMKAVFPLLEGIDLASCMIVCKQWRDLARDDYFWKCLCAKRWPSISKRPNPPTVSYYKLYQSFYKRRRQKTLLRPRISFDDLEFFIDIWAENRLLFSEMVPGSVLQHGVKVPPSGVCETLKYHLEAPEFKMTLPVEPRFTISYGQTETVSVSVLVGRKDSNKVARIINKSMFDYIDQSSYKALAFDYLDISPVYPFLSGIRAWISLLFMEDGNEGSMDVFGIQMDFCDVANTKEEVLLLLDMLDWQ
ncbi:F-box protein At5g39250-like [Prosopis cineraria]|uniref:F-box protein At5g39250-like n=1 Tax=Prosopis cineraria TaxID=364024 RepID=UPI0024104ED2|nr:F-box protein At5g39250-like [Prosopis cineraria]XP_054808503.1 F-box protein At5g39250-like [Prosopis cineraria]